MLKALSNRHGNVRRLRESTFARKRQITETAPYLFGNVCLYVCMFVRMFAIGARTVGATELKFGMELGLYPEKVLAKVRAGRTPPPGRGRPKSASGGPCSPNRAFLGKLYKTKVEEHP